MTNANTNWGLLAAVATIAAVLPTGALADTASTVTVTKFHQSYPYSGRATENLPY